MSLKALASKYGPAALGTYTVVTTTFFTTIYATLSAGYDATPLVLGVVDGPQIAGRRHDARAGAVPNLPKKFSLKDKLIVPNLPDGKYLLSWRWDCEQTPQIWNTCADITLV